MPRPGFVLDVDKSTPPTLFWHGEGFRLEKLPADRSRVIYAPEPHEAIDDIDGAIRTALLNPIDMDPLPSLLFPGMKLTIAFDDVSLPLPKMRRPDLRQRIIEQVLTMAADAPPNESWKFFGSPEQPEMDFHFVIDDNTAGGNNWRLTAILESPQMLLDRAEWGRGTRR